MRIRSLLITVAAMSLLIGGARAADNCNGEDYSYDVLSDTFELGKDHSLIAIRQMRSGATPYRLSTSPSPSLPNL